METSDCAAAIDPSIFHSRGGTELERFLAGTEARGEIALVVAIIGNVDDELIHSPFGEANASILFPGIGGSIGGTRLPAGVRPSLSPDARGADKDLALRLLQRPADAPWWRLSLNGTSVESATGPPEHRHPGGRLEPILIDTLGDPVVAVWVSDSDDQRWYSIPDGTDPDVVLSWLISQGLPEHVPSALRRVRAPHAVIPSLQSQAEQSARRALADLQANYEQELKRREAELREATEEAEPIRHGLLYGTGDELVQAVAVVLSAANLTVVDLDEDLGGTKSADLLVSCGANRSLVEVKSASGNASEKLVADLERHLQTWPQLRPDAPVGHGVLVVNHQHRLDPDERATAVFTRPEFVAALGVAVVSSRQLFDWWRDANWTSIHAAVVSRSGADATTSEPSTPDSLEALTPDQTPKPTTRRWWRQGRRDPSD